MKTIAGFCISMVLIIILIGVFTPPEFWDWVDGQGTWSTVKLFVSGLIVGGLCSSIAWMLVLMCAINYKK